MYNPLVGSITMLSVVGAHNRKTRVIINGGKPITIPNEALGSALSALTYAVRQIPELHYLFRFEGMSKFWDAFELDLAVPTVLEPGEDGPTLLSFRTK